MKNNQKNSNFCSADRLNSLTRLVLPLVDEFVDLESMLARYEKADKDIDYWQ